MGFDIHLWETFNSCIIWPSLNCVNQTVLTSECKSCHIVIARVTKRWCNDYLYFTSVIHADLNFEQFIQTGSIKHRFDRTKDYHCHKVMYGQYIFSYQENYAAGILHF